MFTRNCRNYKKTSQKKKTQKTIIFAILLISLIFVFLLDLAFGSVHIPIQEVINVLLGGEAIKASWNTIILKFRLPKALTATLAGAALGVSGLQMQTLFKNPLAGPFILGISSGASLGVALIVLAVNTTAMGALIANFGIINDLALVIAATLGAGLVLGMVLLISHHVADSMTLLILGLLLGYATSAIVSILLQFSENNQIQSYLQWTFGSFGGVTWRQMVILAPVVLLGLIVSLLLSKPLNVMLLGETQARTLGLSIQTIRFWIIGNASILAGAITAFCGPIGFLGVVVPHLCRSLFKTVDHKILIPVVAVMGAIIALLADLLSQLPGSQSVLPLNSVTALIGTPIVMWVILYRHRSI